MDAPLNPQTSLISAEYRESHIDDSLQPDSLPGPILPVVAVRAAVYFPGAHFPFLATREPTVLYIEQTQPYHPGSVSLVSAQK